MRPRPDALVGVLLAPIAAASRKTRPGGDRGVASRRLPPAPGRRQRACGERRIDRGRKLLRLAGIRTSRVLFSVYTLGGLLFTLNAVGYVVGAIAMVIPLVLAVRFRWAIRLGLMGYAATTIIGWAIQGPYYSTAYLAKAGLRVICLERRDVLGGACVTEEVWPGARVSRASYVVSMLQPRIVDDLRLRDFGYRAVPLDPAYAALNTGRNWRNTAFPCAKIESRGLKALRASSSRLFLRLVRNCRAAAYS